MLPKGEVFRVLWLFLLCLGGFPVAAQGRGPEISASEFPDPRERPELCDRGGRFKLEFTRQGQGRRVPAALLCDPESLLPQRQLSRFVAALVAFEAEFGVHLGTWSLGLGVAVVRETAEPAPAFVQHLSYIWGLQGPRAALLLLRGGRRPTAVLAGGPDPSSPKGSSSPYSLRVSTEAQASALLLSGRFAEALETMLEALVAAERGNVLPGPGLVMPKLGSKLPEQRLLEKWESQFQVGEVWENVCAGEPCKELFLGDVRQVSDRFDSYYHEAMTFPALVALGPAGARRVLVLGGGDGGIASLALQFDTVEKVVVVEIDARVTEASKQWFPQTAAGLEDPRCEVVHGDAIAWVESRRGNLEFDLIVIDFTDEPLEGFWNPNFYRNVKALLHSGGVLVQNVGTLIDVGEVKRMFGLHAATFSRVHPLSLHTPDYHSPYLLALSTDHLDPLAVDDWSFWERQGLGSSALLYWPRQHGALFALTAATRRALGLSVPGRPERPGPLPGAPPGEPQAKSAAEAQGELRRLERKRTPHGEVLVLQERACSNRTLHEAGVPATCQRLLKLQSQAVLGPLTECHHEVMALPALNLLGKRARRLLVLGGGTSKLVVAMLGFPQVRRLVVVDINPTAVEIAQKWFPEMAAAFEDPRTELVIADALEWAPAEGDEFDAIFLNLEQQPWKRPSPETRIPRTLAFLRNLHSLLSPGGLLVQALGSIGTLPDTGLALSLHRATFPSVLPMVYSSLEGAPDTQDELDGRHVRSPMLMVLSSTTPQLDPDDVDWELWERAEVSPECYHASLHKWLFVLPAELLVSLGTANNELSLAPPAAAEVKPPSAAAAMGEGDKSLVHSLAIEANECGETELDSSQVGLQMLGEMARLAELTPLGNLSHHFNPVGVTTLLLVSESHLSLHTWPEFGFAVVDVVSCKALPHDTVRSLKEAVGRFLGCGNVSGALSLRGGGPGLRNVAEKHWMDDEL